MSRVNWIEHKGKRILFYDFSNLTELEFERAIDEAIEVVSQLPPGSELLDLADVRGTETSRRATTKLREFTAVRDLLTGMTAIIGLSSFERMMASLMRRGMGFAPTVEEAKDWLVDR